MRNIGYGERAFRVTAGVVILGLYGALAPPLQYLTLLGLLPLGTGLTGFCPVRYWLDRRAQTPNARGAR